MDCSLIADHLIGYHFAAVTEEERTQVEQHLLGCSSCLRAYLALKRDVERGPGRPQRPSAATRERLRARVAAAFPPRSAAGGNEPPPAAAARAGSRRSPLWFRHIPLYQGLTAAAVAAAIALLVPALLRGRADARGGDAVVDTRRPVPESLTIY
jgi:anti-sigma factor RsiW